MHRNANLDDVFDAIVEIVERIDPPPVGMITTTQQTVLTEFMCRQLTDDE